MMISLMDKYATPFPKRLGCCIKCKQTQNASICKYLSILITIELRKHMKCLPFHDNYEFIMNLLAATCLKKVGIWATEDWKSKQYQKETPGTKCCNKLD